MRNFYEIRVKKYKAIDNWIISRNVWNQQRGKLKLASSGSRGTLNTFDVHKNKTNRGGWIYVALGRSRVQFWAQQQNQEVLRQYHKNAAIEFTRKWKVNVAWARSCKSHHYLRMFPHIPCTCPDIVITHKAALPHLALHACSNLKFVSLCRQQRHTERCSAFPMQFVPLQKQLCSSATTRCVQYRYGSPCNPFPFFFILKPYTDTWKWNSRYEVLRIPNLCTAKHWRPTESPRTVLFKTKSIEDLLRQCHVLGS
jgi:hypothetical protein